MCPVFGYFGPLWSSLHWGTLISALIHLSAGAYVDALLRFLCHRHGCLTCLQHQGPQTHSGPTETPDLPTALDASLAPPKTIKCGACAAKRGSKYSEPSSPVSSSGCCYNPIAQVFMTQLSKRGFNHSLLGIAYFSTQKSFQRWGL